MSLTTKQRFETAQDWIRFSMPMLDSETVELIALICKKRKGVWTILKNSPRDDSRAIIWHALKNGNHAKKWGNLASWKEGTTMLLMRASEEDRAIYNKLFDLAAGIKSEDKNDAI